MHEASLHLAEAAVARLCHDLGGSVGAAMNALELLLPEPAGPAATEAMQLAADATREIAARLRLARMVWSCDRPMPVPELLQLTEGLHGRPRFELAIDLLPDARTNGAAPRSEPLLDASAARLLLATLSMAAESLRGPGRITLSGQAGQEAVVILEGPRAAWPADLPTMIANASAPWAAPDPRTLTPRLVALLAAAANARISLLLSTGPSSQPPPLLIQFSAP